MFPSPFKCPGGKSRLADSIIALMPERFQGYAEPFVGAGAVFRTMAAEGRLEGLPVLLNDAGDAVAQVWRGLRDDTDNAQNQLTRYILAYIGNVEMPDRQREMYLNLRQQWNQGDRSVGLQLFLRKTSFNGLWRENRAGGMNVPWGKYKSVGVPDLKPLGLALRELNVRIEHGDFEPAMDAMPDGSVIYCDPPYHKTFSAYTAAGFKETDHIRLIQACARLSERCTVILSNSPTEFILDHIQTSWPRTRTFEVTATRSIACKVSSRGDVKELAVVGGPR